MTAARRDCGRKRRKTGRDAIPEPPPGSARGSRRRSRPDRDPDRHPAPGRPLEFLPLTIGLHRPPSSREDQCGGRMMDDVTLSLLVRAGATAMFVLAMSWIVARAQPGIAAMAIAMPVVVGPGFLVLALERDAAFVLRAAEDGLGALAGTVAFAVVVARLAGHRGTVVTLSAGLACWALTVTVAGLATGWIANGCVFLLAYAAGMYSLGRPATAGQTGTGWSPRVATVRALVAGFLVGAVTLAAARLGPVLSATLIAVPVGMLFVALSVLRDGSPEAARRVMAAGARGTAALALFLVVLRAMLPSGVPPVPAVAASAGASVVLAVLLGLSRRRRGDPG
jgi:hypothetical protein